MLLFLFWGKYIKVIWIQESTSFVGFLWLILYFVKKISVMYTTWGNVDCFLSFNYQGKKSSSMHTCTIIRSIVTVGSIIYKSYAKSLKLWNSYTNRVCFINIVIKKNV